MPASERQPLRADHRCRWDDLAYGSIGEWHEAHIGLVPIQPPQLLSRLATERGLSFADAFRLAVTSGALVHVDDEKALPGERTHQATLDVARARKLGGP